MHVEDIQREMREVRASLGSEVRTLAQQARNSTDWRYYVRRYPVACLGAVAVAGYLLVPKRLARGGRATNGSSAPVAAGTVARLAADLQSIALRTLANAALQHGMEFLNWRKVAPQMKDASDASQEPDAGLPAPPADAASRNAEPW